MLGSFCSVAQIHWLFIALCLLVGWEYSKAYKDFLQVLCQLYEATMASPSVFRIVGSFSWELCGNNETWPKRFLWECEGRHASLDMPHQLMHTEYICTVQYCRWAWNQLNLLVEKALVFVLSYWWQCWRHNLNQSWPSMSSSWRSNNDNNNLMYVHTYVHTVFYSIIIYFCLVARDLNIYADIHYKNISRCKCLYYCAPSREHLYVSIL